MIFHSETVFASLELLNEHMILSVSVREQD